MFHTANTQALWESSTREMQQAFGSPDDLKVLRENLIAQYGTEAAVLSERTETQSGFRVYTRVARWTGTDVPLQLVIAINELDKVAGFWIRPQAVAAYSPHLNYQTKANLCLPVDGEWYVYWGGRTVEDNYHAADQGQRFALDLLVLQNGGSHAGEPKVLANYHCWGRSVVAPAAGVIVHAVDGLKDQTIGASDPTNPAGNHVVIDFGSKEYGFLAHLQRNSIRVSAGDRVARGQEIGLCGNSGNSSEPHLHFHLQTSPVLGQGDGLPAQFLDYRANGVLIGRGEPTRGEMIRSENSPSSPRRRPRP
ncbi:MAG: M23 family metallopeptidase [Pseudomonadota bacterium]